MARLRRLLVRSLGVLAGAAAVWLVVAVPVETGEGLPRSGFRGESLAAVEEALGALPPSSGGELLAGVAKVEIVPPIDWNVPLGGNRRLRFARAEGVRPESVWARALALRQGDSAFVLVSADIMVIYPGLAESILARIRERIDIDRDQLMLVAAHSHSGPGGYWEGTLPEMSVGPYQERLRAFLVDRLARAAVEAWQALEPAEAQVGVSTQELPVRNRTGLEALENAELGVVRFEARGSGRVAELVNYSAHPTNLLRDNRLLTVDYPALLAMELERGNSSRTMVFTPGTIGDQKPWYHREKDATVKANGIARLLREGVLTAELETIDEPRLETLEVEVAMPPLQPRLVRSDWLGSWATRKWLTSALFPDHLKGTVVQVARLGNVVLLGAPSDLATSVAEPLFERARRAGLRVFFVSMAEDWIGYVMTQDEYLSVDYKETSQFHGPLSGPLFSEIYAGLIDGLAARAAADAAARTSSAPSPRGD